MQIVVFRFKGNISYRNLLKNTDANKGKDKNGTRS